MSAKLGIHFKDIKSGNYDKSIERIQCAAIWYKDFPLVKDNIPIQNVPSAHLNKKVIVGYNEILYLDNLKTKG